MQRHAGACVGAADGTALPCEGCWRVGGALREPRSAAEGKDAKYRRRRTGRARAVICSRRLNETNYIGSCHSRAKRRCNVDSHSRVRSSAPPRQRSSQASPPSQYAHLLLPHGGRSSAAHSLFLLETTIFNFGEAKSRSDFSITANFSRGQMEKKED